MRPKYKQLYNKKLQEINDLKKELGIYQRAFDYLCNKRQILYYCDTTVEDDKGEKQKVIAINIDGDFEEQLRISKK